jgi:hypothetical protein
MKGENIMEKDFNEKYPAYNKTYQQLQKEREALGDPYGGIGKTTEELEEIARKLGYPNAANMQCDAYYKQFD